MRKTTGMRLVLAAMLALVLVAALSACAAKEPPEASLPPQDLENAAIEKYNTLIAAWAYDPAYPSDTDADFPAFYGGAYIDEAKRFVLQVTSLNEDVTAYFEELIDLTNVVFEEVTYSYRDLQREMDAIAEKLAQPANRTLAEQVSGLGISLPDNAVCVYVISPASGEGTAALQQELRDKISGFENLVFTETAGKDVPAAG